MRRRKKGELSIREAADRMGVHEDTVRKWSQAAVANEPSRLKGHVRRDLLGWYWIQEARVTELVDQAERGLAEYA